MTQRLPLFWDGKQNKQPFQEQHSSALDSIPKCWSRSTKQREPLVEWKNITASNRWHQRLVYCFTTAVNSILSLRKCPDKSRWHCLLPLRHYQNCSPCLSCQEEALYFFSWCRFTVMMMSLFILSGRLKVKGTSWPFRLMSVFKSSYLWSLNKVTQWV